MEDTSTRHRPRRNSRAPAALCGDTLTADHLWSVVDAGGGYAKLVNKNSGLVLGIDGMSTSSGAQALQWDDSGTADHLWSIVAEDGSTPFTS
ncbi:RICIN domain-containing protein [Streptomyces adelaidensis]|uniref:RICIN domain-containing protein n=1 Tax=Streptomyces adelaidensis TaxID=2796465 RepID=UPI001F1D1844|nr:RICIN domain-containing protein [Streptomyces adelaidensis]